MHLPRRRVQCEQSPLFTLEFTRGTEDAVLAEGISRERRLPEQPLGRIRIRVGAIQRHQKALRSAAHKQKRVRQRARRRRRRHERGWE
jgi:hypothetical protein